MDETTTVKFHTIPANSHYYCSTFTREDREDSLVLGLLCEEFLQLRAEIFPRSKDVFPYWNGLCVGDSTTDFRQSNQLPVQPGENRDSLITSYKLERGSLTCKLCKRPSKGRYQEHDFKTSKAKRELTSIER